MKNESFYWKTKTVLTKRHNPNEEPYEVRTIHGNCGLVTGFNMIWGVISEATTSFFGNASAQLVVGNGTTAANATQTALIGDSTYGQSMDTGYPTNKGEDSKLYWKGVFASANANFAWEEWGISDANDVFLNRKVESLGTKSGGEWTLEVYLELQNS
jgi:hypothetical protein